MTTVYPALVFPKPSPGASNVGAVITCVVTYTIDPDTFPSFAEYEIYRERFGVDAEFIAADRIRDESGCVIRYERTFMRPLLPDTAL